MLAEAVIEGAEKLRGTRSGRIYPSNVSICPVRTFSNLRPSLDPPSSHSLLVMNDGKYQETQMIDDLERAGFSIKDRQEVLHIGPMRGRGDGLIKVGEEWCLLECKATNGRYYADFKKSGFQAQPGWKVQTQLYLHSEELRGQGITKGFVYTKHRDSCWTYDLPFEYEPQFATALVTQVEKILDGWIPEPVKIPLCSTCKLRVDCWKATLIDFSGVGTASMPEMVEQWKRGKHFQTFGKELVEEARIVFEVELGDKSVVTIDDLKVSRINSIRSGISRSKFVEVYGPEALPGVWEETPVSQMRSSEITL